jgi:hypothetical protein
MRPQLFWGGAIVFLSGAGIYLVLLLDIAVPLAVGGAIMIIASFFLPEKSVSIAPPDGFTFCVFCSTPVPLNSDRCPHCNGLQPRRT